MLVADVFLIIYETGMCFVYENQIMTMNGARSSVAVTHSRTDRAQRHLPSAIQSKHQCRHWTKVKVYMVMVDRSISPVSARHRKNMNRVHVGLRSGLGLG